MTAKRYLEQIGSMDMLIKMRQKELDDLRDASTAIGSFDYSKDRVQTTPSGDPPYLVMLDRILELEQDIQRCLDKKHTIMHEIQDMENPTYSQILFKRYVEGKGLNAIADEMNYSYQHVRRMHGWALQEFERCYKMLH
ncbi:MAG: hypothetical protein LUE23_04375 [Lachnospiraceae bacterium]|nr:hypothetical protein [Lachnospiraceae bacterium]